MGIGAGLGFDPGITAASIICGAFFGDKLSPLSDTTNMAAAVSGVPLLRHVRHMVNTITPAYIITIILYAIIGFKQGSGVADTSQLNAILSGISEHFQIGIIPALPHAAGARPADPARPTRSSPSSAARFSASSSP